MKSVYINGIGCISRAGNTPSELWDNIAAGKENHEPPGKINYKSVFEKTELRRMTRYAKLSAEVSAACAADTGIEDFKNRNNENVGIIFTTGFGASESNVKFFESAAKKEPDLCSPLTFASTVPNYSLGNVCILLGIKGYSAMLLGGNPFDIALPVLRRDKAESMIIGAEEEYCREFFEAVDSTRTSTHGANDTPLSECSAAFYVSCHKTVSSYAEIEVSGSFALEKSPLLDYNYDAFEKQSTPVINFISETADKITSEKLPDAIFGVGEQLSFGRKERLAMYEYFPEAPYISSVRKLFGETLGSSFFAGVAAAALCLKNRKIPFCNKKYPCRILVTGLDVQGNYMYVLLRTVSEELT